jgi:uncharacterized protein YjbI with pentapeptide repeats
MVDTPIAIDGPDADAGGKKEAPKEADPYDFGAVEEALNDAARRVNAIWISFIVLCVYVFIATFTVTPAALFRDAPVKLPIFNADLPLKVYFVMAPVLVLALHAYLIVLTQGLAEKIVAYEGVLSRSSIVGAWYGAGRKTIRSRLDISIIVRAMSARNAEMRNGVDFANGVIAGLTMFVMPVALLLLTQLVFLPYQEKTMTWVHRGFVVIDLLLCGWLLLSLRPWPRAIGRAFAVALVLLAAGLSVIAAFPGEWIYAEKGHWPQVLTEKMFEGPPDPVDYVHQGGALPFPNRLILPDNPKLAEAAGASAGGVSLSVRGRNFRKAVFDRSNLARVDFSAADLTEASLQGAKLEGAKFECARPATFTEINGDDDFYRAYDSTYTPSQDCTKLESANLAGANLDNASFQHARMNETHLESATFKNANFREAELRGAHFDKVRGGGANFSYAWLMGANFKKAQISTANFTGANLQGARLRKAELAAAGFSSALLTGACFESAQLRAANFTDASLQGARFSNSDLQAADFSGAHMQGVDMSGAYMQAASFEKTFLHAATFDGAEMQGASLKGAALRDASLRCATLFRTDFENTDRAQTIESLSKGCSYATHIYYSYANNAIYDINKYDIQTDRLPKPRQPDVGVSTSYSPDTTSYYSPDTDVVSELQHPEKLDAKTFAAALDKLTSDLPDDAKARVVQAFQRLNPATRTTKQDAAEKALLDEWKSATQVSHDTALAARLESIACVGEGAPYVARGLLQAGRFDLLPVNEKMNDEEKGRIKRINERNLGILERLKHASKNGASNCPGAIGLVEEDFPKPAPAK